MNSKKANASLKALVTVFEDIETAKCVVEKLHDAGYPLDKIELVTRRISIEALEVNTPQVQDSTNSRMLESSVKWGGVGVGAGLLTGLLTPFPGIALGMAIVGGMTGIFMGGIAGVDESVADDSVDLPTLEEYEQMVNSGLCLVVVQGDHDQVTRAKDIVSEFPDIHRHVHVMHGHDYHEHPAHRVKK